jgi:hypothetical protein
VKSTRMVPTTGTDQLRRQNDDSSTLAAEVERLHVLQSYDILDSDDHEPEFAYTSRRKQKNSLVCQSLS